MKKMNLRQALLELKEAKSFAQRIAATSKLVNQTAFKAGQILYGTHAADTSSKAAPQSMPTHSQSSHTIAPTASQPAQHEQKVDYATTELIKLNEDLKALRIAKELAPTDEQRNAIHFKILRLERERRDFLAKRKTP